MTTQLKGLYNKVAGSGLTELVTASGKLYFVRPHGVRSSKECIYIDAVASIRKTSREYLSELVVTRAWAEGEQDLVEEEEETSEERPFLIDQALNFALFPTAQDDLEDPDHPSTSFTWWNAEGDDDEIYLFVCDADTPTSIIKRFENIMYRCMYERKYQLPANHVTEKDLQEFVVEECVTLTFLYFPIMFIFLAIQLREVDEPVPPPPTASTSRKQPLFQPESDSEDDDLAAGLSNLSVTKQPSPIKASPKGKARQVPVPIPDPSPEPESQTSIESESVNLPPDDRVLLISEPADLCLYDAATEMFMEQENLTQINLWLVKGLEFPCACPHLCWAGDGGLIEGCTGWLTVAGKGGHLWISTPIDNKMPITFNEVHSFPFPHASVSIFNTSPCSPIYQLSSISPTNQVEPILG